MSEIDSTIRLSLHDAASNCIEHNAIAVLTLRSGVQLRGKLERPSPNFDTTVHLETRGGWITALMEEIAAIEAVPKSGPPGSFGDDQ